MNETLIATFVAALRQDRKSMGSKTTESWRRKAALLESGSCLFCGRLLIQGEADPGEATVASLCIEPLISRRLGGQHDQLNLIASCIDCQHRKDGKDWITCPLAPDELARETLASRRLQVMETCQNHLLRSRETAKTKPYVLTQLRQRWAHPRFTVRAALTEKIGLLGYGPGDHVPTEIVVQLSHYGAFPVRSAAGVFTVPAANFHALVWDLIDQNAWVRRVDLGPENPDPTVPDGSLERWHETFISVGDIHRRRERMPWVHASKRPNKHELPMDPRERRHLAGLLALRTSQPIDSDWLALHRMADEDHLAEKRRKADKAWLTRHS